MIIITKITTIDNFAFFSMFCDIYYQLVRALYLHGLLHNGISFHIYVQKLEYRKKTLPNGRTELVRTKN